VDVLAQLKVERLLVVILSTMWTLLPPPRFLPLKFWTEIIPCLSPNRVDPKRHSMISLAQSLFMSWKVLFIVVWNDSFSQSFVSRYSHFDVDRDVSIAILLVFIRRWCRLDVCQYKAKCYLYWHTSSRHHRLMKRVVKGGSRSRFTKNKMAISCFTGNKMAISRLKKFLTFWWITSKVQLCLLSSPTVHSRQPF